MYPMNPYAMLIYAEQRSREYEARAMQSRLVREALAGKERHPRCYDFVFYWLGRQLIALGSRLQARYDSGTSPALAIQPGSEGSAAPAGP
jgi:hypothetical protein